MSLNVYVLQHGQRLLWVPISTLFLFLLDGSRSRFPVSTNLSSTVRFMWVRHKK